MKVIKINLPYEHEQAIIVPLADLHLGDPLCNEKTITDYINYIKDTPNAYCILNGDLINNSTRNSIGDVFSEQLTPMQQLKRASELLKPIANKILCMTNGNHEERTWRYDGIDITELLARELGIEDRYARESAVLFVKVGTEMVHHRKRAGGRRDQIMYSIFVTHGRGGGRKEGAKAIRLADMASIVDTDIYIHSHTHLPMIMKQAYYRTQLNNTSVTMVDKLFVNTSSMLNYGGYGEVFEMKPNATDTPKIYLSGVKKAMTAHL